MTKSPIMATAENRRNHPRDAGNAAAEIRSKFSVRPAINAMSAVAMPLIVWSCTAMLR